MHHTICLSGWGQAHDSLEIIAPQAQHVPYKPYPSFDAFAGTLHGIQCDMLIGWSLGGQLAARLVAAGILQPKRLVLLAAPFQFLADTHILDAMQPALYDMFERH